MYFCLFMYNIVPTFLIAELETLVSMSKKPVDSKKSVPRSTVPTLIHSKVTIKLYRIQPHWRIDEELHEQEQSSHET